MIRFREFLKNTGGNVGIIIALASVPLFGAAGIAVDMFRKDQVEVRLQAALDAAALAGAMVENRNKRKIRKIVRKYAMMNGVDEYVRRANAVKIRFGRDRRLTVTVKSRIKTTVAGVLGFKTLNVYARSEASPRKGGAEIALVVDTTGSMGIDNRLDNLRTAATEFIDVIDEANVDSDDRLKVSIVPYAGYVNVGTSSFGAWWLGRITPPRGAQWLGCVGPRENSRDARDGNYNYRRIPPVYSGIGDINSYGVCAPEIMPLTTRRSDMVHKLNQLTAFGNTYIPAGLMWGWRTLSSGAPYSEASTYRVARRNKIVKFIILMTDGANTLEKVAGTPYLVNNGGNTARADAKMLQVCDAIKKSGITVYTIGFKIDFPSMQQNLAKCANTPEHYFDADSAEQLSEAYRTIADRVTAVHLSR